MDRTQISNQLKISGEWLFVSKAERLNHSIIAEGSFTHKNTRAHRHLVSPINGHGVIPGVIVLEALLQSAALLASGGNPHILAIIQKCSFNLTSPARIGPFTARVRETGVSDEMVQVEGRLTCRGKIVCLASMTFSLKNEANFLGGHDEIEE